MCMVMCFLHEYTHLMSFSDIISDSARISRNPLYQILIINIHITKGAIQVLQ